MQVCGAQRGRGEITINVTMAIDTDGILTVSGTAEGTDIKRDIAVRAPETLNPLP